MQSQDNWEKITVGVSQIKFWVLSEFEQGTAVRARAAELGVKRSPMLLALTANPVPANRSFTLRLVNYTIVARVGATRGAASSTGSLRQE
jgi:hypothetical protein